MRFEFLCFLYKFFLFVSNQFISNQYCEGKISTIITRTGVLECWSAEAGVLELNLAAYKIKHTI